MTWVKTYKAYTTKPAPLPFRVTKSVAAVALGRRNRLLVRCVDLHQAVDGLIRVAFPGDRWMRLAGLYNTLRVLGKMA